MRLFGWKAPREGARPALSRAGSGVALGEWPAGLRPDWPAGSTPRVMFTPSGLARPVRLEWRWAEGRQRWHWRHAAGLQVVNVP